MTGKKYDGEKPQMYLLPPKAITEVAKVLTFGASKYGPENWRKLDDLQNRYSSAAMRHIFAHIDGSVLDEESDLSHLAHAICCLLFKLEIELENGKSKKEELRDPYIRKHSESHRGSRAGLTYNQKRSLRNAEYSIQYDSSDPNSGGL